MRKLLWLSVIVSMVITCPAVADLRKTTTSAAGTPLKTTKTEQSVLHNGLTATTNWTDPAVEETAITALPTLKTEQSVLQSPESTATDTTPAGPSGYPLTPRRNGVPLASPLHPDMLTTALSIAESHNLASVTNSERPAAKLKMVGLSVAVGVDSLHSAGSPYLELRYSGQRWEHWSAYLGMTPTLNTLSEKENQTDTSLLSPRLGVELYETWLRGRLLTGAGLVLSHSNNIVGTPLRYQMRFGWRFNNGWSVELVHESNCSSVCDNSLMSWIPHGPSDKENLGYNFFVVRKPL